MNVERKVQDILKDLKKLHADLNGFRKLSAEWVIGFKQVKDLYDQRLDILNSEAERLEILRISLRDQLETTKKTFSTTTDTTSHLATELASTDIPRFDDKNISASIPSETFVQTDLGNFRRIRKTNLADFIDTLLDPSQRELVFKTIINPMIVDDNKDFGEILEVIEWGDLWESRAAWETLDQQCERLLEWQQALKDRLAYWQSIVQSLQNDSCYALFIEWEKGETEWDRFLDNLVNKQAKENDDLRREVDILEVEINSRRQVGEEI